MGATADIVRQAYAAFGRGDVPAILELVDKDVDWEFVGPKSLPYAGPRHGRAEVGAFFAEIPQTDLIKVFEPREFIEAGEHLTVLGWTEATTVDTRRDFSTAWVHVFTVKNGQVTRWRGFTDTAARYGV